ncbi:uncharacterized protein OGAPODRAFT_92214 [Ogataea polymorpha]|uniref:uncharacterized protein n=1 Tax=Ogataea polymorpha TaxID=460523 RepID=UPI0007F5327F|nr:uncharacterized protein OGAPODRAFT_92214 [Ogataea polymorpha]KAG7934000.1 hypothetical protein KL934_002922 [Ogataea polymorpha]OBA18755.1 hypothetical protein OGAPODRAFT_92214 [Ogataea polymorpha]
MSLHLWGAPFDAESLAAANFVAENCKNIEIELLYDSNYFLSPNGKLPVLLDGDLTLEGYKEIVNHLINKHNLLACSVEQKLLDQGLIEHLLSNLEVVSCYNFFLNKDNFEGYTRGVFKNILPFPFQYMPPLNLKARAAAICETAGISSTEESNQLRQLKEREKTLRETPTLSNFDQSQRNASLKVVLDQMDILTNMRCVSLLEETIKLVKDLGLPKSYPSSILFDAYIQCNTDPNLKTDFVLKYLKSSHPDLLQSYQDIQPQPVSFATAVQSLARNYL